MNLSYSLNRKGLRSQNVLVFGLVTLLALSAIFKYKYQPLLQFQILAILAMVYLIWALIHHLLDKSLTLEVILEYAFTAILALVVFYGLLL